MATRRAAGFLQVRGSTAPAEELSFIVHHSGAVGAVVEDMAALDKLVAGAKAQVGLAAGRAWRAGHQSGMGTSVGVRVCTRARACVCVCARVRAACWATAGRVHPMYTCFEGPPCCACHRQAL